jgi:hypothetical protein
MSRYARVTRKPMADWVDDDGPMIPSITVDDHEAVDTGLLWQDGEPIMRTPNPMGFGRDGEW